VEWIAATTSVLLVATRPVTSASSRPVSPTAGASRLCLSFSSIDTLSVTIQLTDLTELCPLPARSASIRIPKAVAVAGKGYFEDRRPASNADPYQICDIMVQTTLLS
jgi:hypothetical protein